jgi:hypothetical protein
MIPYSGIWRAAMAIVKRYGDDAMLEAAARASGLSSFPNCWHGALGTMLLPGGFPFHLSEI